MPDLTAVRTMIVEDDILLALDLADALRGAGHEIMGPFSSVDAALKGVNADRPQIAILDIDLNGHLSFPVADALARENVPFLWLSASSPDCTGALSCTAVSQQALCHAWNFAGHGGPAQNPIGAAARPSPGTGPRTEGLPYTDIKQGYRLPFSSFARR